jgi:hypothetical protein
MARITASAGPRSVRQPAVKHVVVALRNNRDYFCGIGSCGVPRPSLAHYVTGMGPMDGSDRCRRSFVLPILHIVPGSLGERHERGPLCNRIEWLGNRLKQVLK